MRFCHECGAPRPEKPKKNAGRFWKGALCGALAAAVLCTGILYFAGALNIDGASRLESGGYASPEIAAKAYINAMKSGDVEGMMGTFAIETYVKNYDLQATLERIGIMMISSPQLFPSGVNDFTDGINKWSRADSIASAIKLQYLTLLFPDSDLLGPGIRFETGDGDDIRALMRELSDDRIVSGLKNLKILELEDPGSLSEHYNDDANRKNMDRQAVCLGADELQSVVARVKLCGEEYLFCFDAVRYGGAWYLYNLSGNIGALLGIDSYAGGVMVD